MGKPVIRRNTLSLLSLANRRFQFQNRRQLFICVRNESLSIVAVRIDNVPRL
jgi:hypothetical protein